MVTAPTANNKLIINHRIIKTVSDWPSSSLTSLVNSWSNSICSGDGKTGCGFWAALEYSSCLVMKPSFSTKFSFPIRFSMSCLSFSLRKTEMTRQVLNGMTLIKATSCRSDIDLSTANVAGVFRDSYTSSFLYLFPVIKTCKKKMTKKWDSYPSMIIFARQSWSV